MKQALTNLIKQHPTITRAAVCTVAAAAGAALNHVLRVPVFGGIELLFGGVFSLLVAVAYGPWWGASVAVAAFTGTLAYWQHPYGLLLYVLEAWSVGWLMHRRHFTMLRSLMLFWVMGGIPLSALYAYKLLQVPYPYNVALVVKNPCNALLVAALVQLVMLSPNFWRIPGAKRSLRGKDRTLSANLFRRFVVIAVIPAAIFAVQLAALINRQQQSDTQNQLRRDSRLVRQIVQTYAQSHIRAIETAATTLEGSSLRSPALDETLARLQQWNGGFMTMLIADDTGCIVASMPPIKDPAGMPPVSDREYFRQPEPGKGAYVSPVFRGRGFGNDLIIAVSAAFTTREGRRAVIEGSLNLSRMGDMIAQNAELDHSDMVLVDNRGQIIFQRGKGAPQSTGELYRLPAANEIDDSGLVAAREPGQQPQRRLVNWDEIPGLNWRLYLHREIWDSDVRVVNFLLFEALGMTVALALAFLVARATAEKFSKPFRHLVSYSTALVQKQMPPPPIPADPNMPTEMDQMALTLHIAARELAQTNQVLEAAVKDRESKNQELVELNRHLDQRVLQRTTELEMARTSAEQANKAKSEFLATVSHELRTPLNVVLGNLHLLQQNVAEPLQPRQIERVGRIKASAEHLLELINDIIDLAKLETGKIHLTHTRVELATLARESIAFFGAELGRKGLDFQLRLTGLDGPVHGDPRRLRQILLNLISNAVKFTPDGGNAGLEVVHDRAGGYFEFSVWDHGIGMSEEQVARLFRPFEQIEATLTRKYEGTGLGLAIVKRLAALHGGTVEVSSAIGEGSRFTVRIPQRRAVDAPHRADSTPAFAR